MAQRLGSLVLVESIDTNWHLDFITVDTQGASVVGARGRLRGRRPRRSHSAPAIWHQDGPEDKVYHGEPVARRAWVTSGDFTDHSLYRDFSGDYRDPCANLNFSHDVAFDYQVISANHSLYKKTPSKISLYKVPSTQKKSLFNHVSCTWGRRPTLPEKPNPAATSPFPKSDPAAQLLVQRPDPAATLRVPKLDSAVKLPAQ